MRSQIRGKQEKETINTKDKLSNYKLKIYRKS